MGKAKRRRQLRTNVEQQAQVPEQFKDIFDSFLNKEIDIAIMPSKSLIELEPEQFFHRKPKLTGVNTSHYASMTVSPLENSARAIFLEHQQEIMVPTAPLIKQYGRGWLNQLSNPQTYEIGINYLPATRANLHTLEKVFTLSLGRMVNGVIRAALQNWSFQPDNILIPVIGMSTDENEPFYLFCV